MHGLMLLREHNWLAPILLGLFALSFHLINLDYASYDLDEAVHVWHAQRTYEDVVKQASNDPNPPIYNLIISAWVKQFGISEFSTRFFSVLMGVLGTFLMYFLAKRNFGLFVGLLAGLFYTLSPIQFRFTHLARPYAMLMVTVLLSYGLLFENLRNRSGWKLLGYFLVTSLMIYVHPTSVFNVPAQMLIVLTRQWGSVKSMIPLVVTSVLSVASFLIWVVSIPYFERDEKMWFDAPDFEAVMYVLDVFYASLWIAFIQIGLLVFLINKSITSRAKMGLSSLLIWIIIPFVLSIVFSHVVKPVFQDKYILSVQPAMFLLLAVLIDQLRKPFLKVTLGAACLVLLLANADFTRNSEGNWKQAVEYLRPLHDSNSITLIDPWYEMPTFGFYFDRKAYEIPDSTALILKNQRVTTTWEDVFDSELAKPRFQKVHVVRAHQGHVQPAVSRETLNSLAALYALRTFPGVAVESYEFGVSLDTLEVIRANFSDKIEGVLSVSNAQEFADLGQYILTKADTNRILKITGALDVADGKELSGVNFVITAERSDGSVLVYESINFEGQLRKKRDEDKRLMFSVSTTGFDNSSTVRAYLWNSKGSEFQVDNFEMIIEN